jgi:hypothetical protein
MKTVVVILGILGLVDAILVPVLIVTTIIEPGNGVAAWFGYLGACVCFGALAVTESLPPLPKP